MVALGQTLVSNQGDFNMSRGGYGCVRQNVYIDAIHSVVNPSKYQTHGGTGEKSRDRHGCWESSFLVPRTSVQNSHANLSRSCLDI